MSLLTHTLTIVSHEVSPDSRNRDVTGKRAIYLIRKNWQSNIVKKYMRKKKAHGTEITLAAIFANTIYHTMQIKSTKKLLVHQVAKNLRVGSSRL